VRVRARLAGTRVERVTYTGVPSFVLHGGVVVKLGARQVRADVAYGGAFYAIVDAESVGVPVDAAHAPDLRRAGQEIARAVEASVIVAHPLEPRLRGIHGTIFTGPPHEPGADLRTVTVFADRAVARSAPGTGGAAIVSVLDAIGVLGADAPFVCEGLIGTRLTIRVAGRTVVGDYNALVPEVEGSAWITGDHTFFIDEADPLADGFRVS
jgi:trans-L-3-hydroxyproline dehydratase